MDEAFKLWNLDIDQAEVLVRAMEQNLNVPHRSTEYAQKDDTERTKVNRKKKKNTFYKAEANTRHPPADELPSNTFKNKMEVSQPSSPLLEIKLHVRLGDRGLKQIQYWLRLTMKRESVLRVHMPWLRLPSNKPLILTL